MHIHFNKCWCIFIYMHIYLYDDIYPAGCVANDGGSVGFHFRGGKGLHFQLPHCRCAAAGHACKVCQCVAVWHSGVQRGAFCCSVLLQFVWFLHCSTVDMLWRATFGKVRLCIAVCFSLKQLVAVVPCRRRVVASHICKRVLLCVAVCCCVLLCVAVCC